MKKIIFLFLAGLFFFSSCEENENVPIVDEFLPTSLTSGTDVLEKFEYDAQGRLNLMDDSLRTIQFYYQGEDLIKTVYTQEENYSVSDYTKTNNKIKANVRLYSTVDNKLLSQGDVEINLNANGMPLDLLDKSYKYRFEYDSKGNLNKKETLIMGQVAYTNTYTYDDKLGFLSKVKTPRWWFVIQQKDEYFYFVNNIASVTDIDQRGQSSTVTWNYRYDDANYPTEIKKVTTPTQHHNAITVNYRKF